MSDLFMKMAQAAVEDKTLFAPYIQQYASQKSLSWEEVALRLQIGSEQLARLALCSRPQPALYNGAMMQVADYVGIESDLLQAFVAEVEGGEATLAKQVPAQLENTSRARTRFRIENIRPMLPKRLNWALGAVALLMVLLLGSFVFAQPDSETATLVVKEGQVTVVQASSPRADERVIVSAGEPLRVSEGDHIYLAASSTAEIRLVDGSTVELAAGTELNLEELLIEDGTIRVHLRLFAGRTLSRVVSVLGVGDRFEISTPSTTASVRGTIFTVAYISAEETYISCDEGEVEVTIAGQESQILGAGMEMTAIVGQPLQAMPQQAPDSAPSPGLVPSPVETPTPQPEISPEQNESTEQVTPQPVPSNAAGAVPGTGDTPIDGESGTGSPPESTPETPAGIPTASDTPPAEDNPPVGSTSSPPESTPDNPTSVPIPTHTPPPAPTVGATSIPPEPTAEFLVTICHKPGTPAQITLTVPPSDVEAHLAHGDTLGPCPEESPAQPGNGNNGGGNNG